MIVVKFGGTSVGDADAIRRAASIVVSRGDRRPIVVVSAMAGVTNALLAIAEQSSRGQLIGAIRSIEVLRERHMHEAETLLGDTDECAEVCAEMSAMIDELAHLTEALNTLGDVTPRSLDAIAAYGEQLSSQLVVAAFKRCGVPAEHVDARDVVITDDAFTRAEPNVDAIGEASLRLLAPLARDGRVPVLGGFIGSNARHLTTTLGRGGSDYSAALIGAALQAEAIEIWTDVDGMLTADPRVVEGAHVLERVEGPRHVLAPRAQ
ncbi:MAG TPA: aspartate kinase, partial [Gemmatimonadaceae bacterium]|nr:aspartate kinase [Gemmatimonadaceae bacterium]